MSGNSKIFAPNRSLGYVSNHIPLTVRYIKSRNENLITTCVGKSFHTYGISHFTLLSVSGLHDSDITAMTADSFHIYSASKHKIYAWRRGTELKHTYEGHESDIKVMIPFGPHLLSIDTNNVLKIWDIKSETIFNELSYDIKSFNITAICHPSTYINKFLLASVQGTMQLWNFKTMKLLYTFCGWKTEITALESSTSIDVVAIGFADGKIRLHDIKYDNVVMEFHQDYGSVTCISFRTDGVAIMATGSIDGHIVFWNLDEKKVESQLMNAHDKSVCGMTCIPGEPLVITSSSDNSLKLWIFDMPDGGARLLRIREGHSEFPTFIRFHDSKGQNILSAAGDSTLRIFNTVTETFNKSLGKASYNRKSSKKRGHGVEDPLIMPPILELSSERTREKNWDDIVCIHSGLGMVTTWSYDKVKMGKHKLLPPTLQGKKNQFMNCYASCVFMTNCGNFVLVGYSYGMVDRFNVQSGIHQHSYGVSIQAYKTPVRGVVSDSLNQKVVTVDSHGLMKFWHFRKPGNEPYLSLQLHDYVTFLRNHRESSLICAAHEDFSVSIVDMDTETIIRRFQGHSSSITDAAFSPDSRWLITAGMDCLIKTWDIPTAKLIDKFKVESACLSMTMSPTGDFLASVHCSSLGIFLWANKTLYSHVSLKAIADSAPTVTQALPSANKIVDEVNLELVDLSLECEDDSYKTPEQIESQITLSNESTSRWQNLLDLDIIKRRNRPKAPLAKPKAAPFFLKSIPSLQMQFDLHPQVISSEPKLLISESLNLTAFGKELEETIRSKNFDKVISLIRKMGPSRIDQEIKSVAPLGGGSIKLMLTFMIMINHMLTSNKDFELAQAYLSLFLKTHGSIIAEEKELRNYLTTIQSSQIESWKTLESLLFYNMSIVRMLKLNF